jgi:hypothetical protein
MSASVGYLRRYESMDPEAILGESPGNFAFERSSVMRAYVEHRRRGGRGGSPGYWEVIIQARGGNYRFESDTDVGPEASRAFS